MNSLVPLKALAEKVATELVFAHSDSDSGLLPVNSLLQEMEQLIAEDPAASGLLEAATQARRCVDAVLESTGTFSASSLRWLNEWIAWWQTALAALATSTALSPFTLSWPTSGSSGTTPESASVPSAPPPAGDSPVAGEPSIVLHLDADRELLNEFIQEANEHLQRIEQEVLVLEENPGAPDTLNAIFRAFHTVKGGSGFLNLTVVQNLAHDLESLLDLARQHKLPVTPAIITIILEGGDALKQFTREIGLHLAGQKAPGPIVVPVLDLARRIRTVLEANNGTSAPAPIPVPSTPQTAFTLPPLEGAKPTPPTPTTELDRKENGPGKRAAATANQEGLATTVKVDTNKLDSLVDLVGEMVIAQSLVVQNRDVNTLANEQLVRDLAQLRRITKDLQRTAMSLRMVPIRTTFQKMHRLIRDVSAKVGKRIQLVTEGEETELDRTIVEEISDPLVHMVRNSVDHGIEKPEIREQKGKPDLGTISLRAFHQGGNIVIEVKDDGAGLDRERIRAKAIEKGLVQPTETLSEAQIFDFILAPGFSTAEKVTELSGRGVGMDVVRRNIEKLRGKIEIQSTPGHGTTFRVFLPLTLAIIDGLVVSVGSACYIVPTLLVRESFRPSADMINTVQGRGEMVNVRGRLRPLLRLYQHLNIEPASTDPTQSIVLVLEAGADARCVLVDRLLGKQEVVIKSLGETFRQSRYLAGAAILGDGRVGLILDPQALVHLDGSSFEEAA